MSLGDAARGPPSASNLGGVITFIFTDIEASTRRWDDDSVSMAEDLALHDELLRSAIEEAGGQVFSHTGDGVLGMFAATAAGLRAAVAGQHALRDAWWAGATPLRVRMALHVCTAESRGGNFFGATLNRAARLIAIGWGSRCCVRSRSLVSSATSSITGSRSWIWASTASPTSNAPSMCSRWSTLV